eukprot:TRINITY_DN7589_c0_g1_i1.p1 TRINITY_DN7589_c0_g1~~TRINITY_DN7589_c0_g1_i1.p1  ORF type:complete len:592 (-),score=64.42 TRINITY_DN7589_c0_g1_i1:95-1870(-)
MTCRSQTITYALRRSSGLQFRRYLSSSNFSIKVRNGPSLNDFLKGSGQLPESSLRSESSILTQPNEKAEQRKTGKKVFIESYGCQMNMSDTEVVFSIMNSAGFQKANDAEMADIIFLNTCAIRENAENKVWQRLQELKSLKQKQRKGITVGVLGCMAERLKVQLLESDKMVDLVVGPDAYRDLPNLLSEVESGHQAINVQLSLEETYADISPVRLDPNNLSAYVSIMRGCNNMCSYCIVPFTRGRERSRPVLSIEKEVQELSDQGYKEIVLLGQNVNSYNDLSSVQTKTVSRDDSMLSKGFSSLCGVQVGGVRFAELLDRVSRINPEIRFRFTSPHPKDFTDDVLHVIKQRPNICKSLHIPAQSGSTRMLERMKRGYTREAYLGLINRIREILPDCAITSDFISGFCGETEEDHEMTLSLLKTVKYDHAFMFAYSLRDKTHAHRNYEDDVPPEVKNRRLQEVIETFHQVAREKNSQLIGKKMLVLVEGVSKRNEKELFGRSDSNKKIIFPDIPLSFSSINPAFPHQQADYSQKIHKGDYVVVEVTSSSSQSLKGRALVKTTLTESHSVLRTLEGLQKHPYDSKKSASYEQI